MTKTVWKPGTMLYPLPPVMVTCGTMENPNVLTVAWTGIVCSDPAMTYISVRPSRFSHELIKNNKEFVINLTTAKMLKAADFCGVRSGRDLNKIKETGLTLLPCEKVKAPLIEQSPLSLECRVTEIKPLGSHDLFLAEIVAVHVDDELLDADGRFELERSGLVAFCHGAYYALGGKLGSFGFSVVGSSVVGSVVLSSSFEVVDSSVSESFFVMDLSSSSDSESFFVVDLSSSLSESFFVVDLSSSPESFSDFSSDTTVVLVVAVSSSSAKAVTNVPHAITRDKKSASSWRERFFRNIRDTSLVPYYTIFLRK